MSRENVEAFIRMTEAFSSGDAEPWVEMFDEDGEFIPQRAPIEGTYRGEARLREFLADNAENFEVFRPEYDDIRDLGDRLLALGTPTIRGREGGVDVQVASALVLTFRDGKVIRFEDYGDRQKALAAVGLSALGPPRAGS